ncbi:MAG: BatD family protein, partial [Candidatus Marinimicrobia bacterium]|nr:BatD family protein [Candidatus Neomarinimicrobiota bacterium]
MILLRPLLLIFSLLSILRADVSVLATVDAKQIGLNETVNFKVTVEGSEGFAQLDISQIEDFTLISGPAQSSSFQWVNG